MMIKRTKSHINVLPQIQLHKLLSILMTFSVLGKKITDRRTSRRIYIILNATNII